MMEDIKWRGPPTPALSSNFYPLSSPLSCLGDLGVLEFALTRISVVAMPKEDRSRRLSQARRTVAIGLVVVLLCGALALSPLLLGRGSLNRFIVAFALMGV